MIALRILGGFLAVLVLIAACIMAWLYWHHRPYAYPDWQTLFDKFEAEGDCRAARYVAFEAGLARDPDGWRKALILTSEDHPCSKYPFDESFQEDLLKSIESAENFNRNVPVPPFSILPYTKFSNFLRILHRQFERNNFPGQRVELALDQLWTYALCFDDQLSDHPIDYPRMEFAIQSVQGRSAPYNERRTRNRARCALWAYSIALKIKPFIKEITEYDPQVALVEPKSYVDWLRCASMFGSSHAAFDFALLTPDLTHAVWRIEELAYEQKFLPALLLLAEWNYKGLYTEKSIPHATNLAFVASELGATLPDYLQKLVDEMAAEEKKIMKEAAQGWGRGFDR